MTAAWSDRREVGSGATWGVVGRVVAALSSMALVPLADRTLPADGLAVFLLVWSFVAFTTFGDLGAGAAVVSRLATARADPRRYVTASFVVGLGASTLLAGAVGAMGALGLTSHLARGAATDSLLRDCLLVFAIALIPNVTFGISLRILQGDHQAATAGRCVAAGNVGQFLLGLVAAFSEAGPEVFVGVALSSQFLTGLLATICVFRDSRLRPRVQAVTRRAVRSLVATGAIFAAIAVTGMIGNESDTVIVSWGLGARAVPAYAVPARMFGFVPVLASVAVAPVWPAVAGWAAEGRAASISAMLRRSAILTGACATLAAVALAIGLPIVLALVAPSVVVPDWGFRVVMVAWAVVHSVSAAYAAILSGLDLVRVQLSAAVAMAIASSALSVLWVHWIGIAGPPLATVLTQGMLVLLPLHFAIRRRLRVLP